MNSAPTILADRLVVLEAGWLRSLGGAIRSTCPPGTFRLETIGEAGLVVCDDFPHTVFNRVFGLTDRSFTEPGLDAAIAAMDRQSVGGVRIQVSSHDLALAAAATARGLIRGSDTTVRLVRPRGPLDDQPPAFLPIRRLDGAAEQRRFGEIIVRGFGLPESFTPGQTAWVAAPEQIPFGAFDGGTLAAVGCVSMIDGVGFLTSGVTLERYRGRGLQRAIMAARIEAAEQCGAAFTCGEASLQSLRADNVSAENLHRLGFRVALEVEYYRRPTAGGPRPAGRIGR